MFRGCGHPHPQQPRRDRRRRPGKGMGSLGPRTLGVEREVREGPPKRIALPPFARTSPEAQPSRGRGRGDRQVDEEGKDAHGERWRPGHQGRQIQQRGRGLGGAYRPNPAGGAPGACGSSPHPTPPPPRLTTAPPTMAVLLSWARQASTNVDPFGGPGRGPCWVGGEGRSEKGFPGSGGESSPPAACRKSKGLPPPPPHPRSPAQKAAAVGGRTRPP